MKTKLAQFVSFFSQIEPRHIQLASFFVVLALSVITKAPSDGGVGPS